MTVEDPLILLAIGPVTQTNEEKLRLGLATLTAEDPRLHVRSDAVTGEVVIGTMSERHLEIAVHRLAREFGVEAPVGRPQVVYKETISQAAEGGTPRSIRLEPVMYVVAVVPEECAVRLVEDLWQRRGGIQSQEHRDGNVTIRARIPLADMFGFEHALSSLTRGRGTYSMVLYEYRPAPESPPLDPEAGVREPRPRVPVGRSGAISLAEPEPDSEDGR